MQKMFYPDSVALIGLSSKHNALSRLVLENMQRWGYSGKIYGVNTRSDADNILGVRIYKHIEELPEVPDLAVCLIPVKLIPEMVGRCGEFGVKNLAVLSGGFSEFSKEGQELAEEVLRLIKLYGIRLVGPNCLALANTENNLCLPFVPIYKAPAGKLSIISQSGGLLLMLLNYLEEGGIGVAKLVSIGNKLDLDEVDFLEYLGQDQQTGVICLYLESIARGKDFVEVAKKIEKPIIVYKSNTSSAGGKAAKSHTAAISNDDDIVNVALDEAGVIRAKNFLDLIELTKAFHLPPMKGRRIFAVSPLGGMSVISADLIEKAGFEFAEMGQDFYDGLAKFSNAGVIKLSNPLDVGDIYDPVLQAGFIDTAMRSDKVDGCIYISQRPYMPPGDDYFYTLLMTDNTGRFLDSILSAQKPLGVCLLGPSNMIREAKVMADYPVFDSPEVMIGALAAQMKFYERKIKNGKQTAEKQKDDALSPGQTSLTGIDRLAAGQWLLGKQGECGEEILGLLALYGIPAAASGVAGSKKEAVEIADELGYPVVMKVVSPDALHKTEAGGVLLDIKQTSQAEEGFDLLRRNLLNYKKEAVFDGVRIQKMAPEGYDLFIGGKYDPSFGPIVYFGAGGVDIEVFQDIAGATCPADPESIRRKLRSLKLYKLLGGFRGKAPIDLEPFLDLIVRVSLLLADFPAIRELDINPLRIINPEGGLLALDARAVVIQDDIKD